MEAGRVAGEYHPGVHMSDQSTSKEPSSAAISWLRDLVRFQSLSGSASNLDLLEMADSALKLMGFSSRFTYSSDGRRANLFASIGGSTGGLLLSGHTDVVPVAGQKWKYSPFELTEDSERLFGRGSCDMKGFIAACMATLQRIDFNSLNAPLHIALTYDEEIGCIGVRHLLDDLAKCGIRPSACIVGEPTNMQAVRSHKGRHAYRCRVLGQAAHSSLSGLGVNSLSYACELVGRIEEQASRLREMERDEGFYVPYSTMAPCRIEGGHANNVIPEETVLDFDLRFLPSTDPERALGPVLEAAAGLAVQMQRRIPQASIAIERRTGVPALAADSSNDAVTVLALNAGAELGPHVAYTTEGGLYQAAGIPAIVCGPGDIAQAHTADEYLLRSQLAACEHFLYRLIAQHPDAPNAK